MKEIDPQPAISVIIPVYNGGDDIAKCLEAVFESRGVDFECIVVDDGSTDGCAEEQAKRVGARLIRLEGSGGPANARNIGAGQALGELLFFTDADVVLHDDALEKACQVFAETPEISAIFGSYDDNPGDPSFLSRYRNLYHHWTHQKGSREASTFWSGCGAIRKKAFNDVEGFNAAFDRPSIEDIELGYRLRKAGHRIMLVPDMLGQHLKHWSLVNMLRTDIFQRGAPWVALLRRFPGVPPDLNINHVSRACVVLAALLFLSLLCVSVILPVATLPFAALIAGCLACQAAWQQSMPAHSRWAAFVAGTFGLGFPAVVFYNFPGWLSGTPLLITALLVVLQFPFYRLVARCEGPAFAAACVPQQILFFLACALSVPLGLFQHWQQPNSAMET